MDQITVDYEKDGLLLWSPNSGLWFQHEVRGRTVSSHVASARKVSLEQARFFAETRKIPLRVVLPDGENVTPS